MRFVVPEVVVTHFHIREGDTVADFGAGSGYFAKPLSIAVGSEGIVYECEIQKNLVEAIGNLAEKEHLNNVRPVWCDLEKLGGSKLPDNAVDIVIMVNTFFQVVEKQTVISEIQRVLRPGGKAIVVDWSESYGGLGPQPEQVMTSQQTKDEFEAGGFTFETDFDAGDHHYGVTFRSS